MTSLLTKRLASTTVQARRKGSSTLETLQRYGYGTFPSTGYHTTCLGIGGQLSTSKEWLSSCAPRSFSVNGAKRTKTTHEEEDRLGLSESSEVYASPLGDLVTRLRAVSLSTGIIGSVGLPLVVALKGGDLPSTGMIAVGMTFCAGTIGTTAAIHFVFAPYVYKIQRIPVRVCHYKKKEGGGEEEDKANAQPEPVPRDFLLKAVSRSVFLRQIDTVFDPSAESQDVQKYSGLRPLW